MMLGMGGPALVLRKFNISGAPSKQEDPVIEIEGRKPGLIAFFLTLIGIDASTSLIVTPRDIRFRKGSLYGEITSMMPLTAVASAHAGFAKPIGYLIAAGGVLFASFAMGIGAQSELRHAGGGAGVAVMVLGLLVSLVLVVSYFMSRKMAVYVESAGGATFGLVFKRSMIEGVTVDIDKVKSLVDIIRELVIACQQRVG
jgi:hypothetical protein